MDPCSQNQYVMGSGNRESVGRDERECFVCPLFLYVAGRIALPSLLGFFPPVLLLLLVNCCDLKTVSVVAVFFIITLKKSS